MKISKSVVSIIDLIGSHFGIPGANATFDYVVIGGGTAGLTIAEGLAEDPGTSVAVIEAGGFYEFDNGNRSYIPGYLSYYLGTAPRSKNTLIDWEQHTGVEAGLGGRSIFYVRGKTLGGSSARNFMVYQRGSKGSYDKWAEELGDPSYSWESFLPFFKKSVTFEPPNTATRLQNATPKYDLGSFSASGEPLKVSYPNFATSFGSWCKLALKQLGLSELTGFTDGNLLGFANGIYTLDRRTQTRETSETAFLRKALRELPDMTVYTRTLAERILFDNTSAATGVAVNSGGMQYVISARKEVILSAGAFRSPQLLMVSGIGPKEELAKFDIPVLADLPGVGQNLWDHPQFGISYPSNLVTHSRMADASFEASQVKAYNSNRTGMLTNSGTDIIAWEKLPAQNRAHLSNYTRDSLTAFPSDWPEIEYLCHDIWTAYTRDSHGDLPPSSAMYVSISAALVAPFSRGNVTLLSTDTADNPSVYTNMLLDPRDQEVAIQAFRRLREIFGTAEMQKILVGTEAFPGFNVSSDAEVLDLIKQAALQVYHAAGTCKMGKTDDPMAVVDNDAKVFGVDRLRVVDVSTFPFLPPGHPQSTVYALAEKIADRILIANASITAS
ncbi:GMC oxidoreductase [Saccharata proteae CBS 121410]|uniref:GMC oxidoreductase n=1 Tax=Saccharata proteae CBS 121410 TaxID=1314787 RepID=A0A6A5YCD0_9PEZI|nr:GMC oxidoreductase [Saccharata proteae CBS 121410]